MDQLSEYRRMQMERKRLHSQITSNEQNITPSASTTPSASLKLRSIEDEVESRRKLAEHVMSSPSEKVMYKKKLAEEEQNKIKEERNLKQQEISRLRSEMGKTHKTRMQVADDEVNKNIVPTTGKPCTIQIRLLDGVTFKTSEFTTQDKLSDICDCIFAHSKEIGAFDEYNNGINLITSFPRRKFTNESMEATTLEQAGLFPSGTVNVERDTENNNGYKIKQQVFIDPRRLEAVASWRLKGDSFEEKERFKNKLRDEEISRKEKEKIEKKNELKRLRMQLEEDKKLRMERNKRTY
ncbi:hypothetical protein AKO1_013627 [Acrasis kona]|uniref:UBX domain-containing protein n=1 Tax=Acrasis kona TaxID=1008807 RepID=A0AAW2YVV4_9EUKA